MIQGTLHMFLLWCCGVVLSQLAVVELQGALGVMLLMLLTQQCCWDAELQLLLLLLLLLLFNSCRLQLLLLL